ncbi:hypothetical protein FQR65_LT11658 [Abscondita terminalis]|nr:hypothetical protein FQR65_LT11658 [Abscondita terminalis]
MFYQFSTLIGTFRRMDTTSNGHNAETWTHRRNELFGHFAEPGYIDEISIDTTPKTDTAPKSVIEHIVESGHNVEKQKLTLHGSEIGRRRRSCNCLNGDRLFCRNKSRPDEYNTETWTQRRNELLDTTSKSLIGCNVEHEHNFEKHKLRSRDISLNAHKANTCFWIVYIADYGNLHQPTLDRLHPHCQQVLNGYNAATGNYK